MAYFINYWKFNEIRKYNHKHPNVSQHSLLFHVVEFVKCWWIFLEFNSKGHISKLKKYFKNGSVVLSLGQ